MSASITSLKFLFPTIRFLIALTASFGLERDSFQYYITLYFREKVCCIWHYTPFFWTIDHVTDLHIKGPVFRYKAGTCCSLWRKTKEQYSICGQMDRYYMLQMPPLVFCKHIITTIELESFSFFKLLLPYNLKIPVLSQKSLLQLFFIAGPT